MTKSILQLTRSPEFALRMKESFAKTAVGRAKLGLPKAVVIEDVVYSQFPDGKLQPVNPRKVKT